MYKVVRVDEPYEFVGDVGISWFQRLLHDDATTEQCWILYYPFAVAEPVWRIGCFDDDGPGIPTPKNWIVV